MSPSQCTTHERLYAIPFIVERQAGKLWTPIFVVFDLTRSGIESESIVSAADALSTRSLTSSSVHSECCVHCTTNLLYYTRCITPKRVTSLRSPSSRHCARATQLHSKKCCSGGKSLATAQDLNLGPPAPETNVLPLDWKFFSTPTIKIMLILLGKAPQSIAVCLLDCCWWCFSIFQAI